MAVGRAIRAGQGFFELFADDSKLVRGLRHAQRRLRQFGKSATAIGASITGIGLAAATPFALSAKTFANFEQSMAKVKAFTQGLTDNEFADLNAMAKKLGATTVFSASQAAEAMSVFALAGFSAQKNLEAIGPALDLAAAGSVEVAEAANIAVGIMSGMQIQADELTNVVDVMAKAMTTAANTDIASLGEAFQYIGPIGNFAGASIEELGAAVQILSNNMIAGEQAGSSLRGIYLALGSQSEQAAAELDRLNISVQDANKNFRPLADIVADFESAIGDLGNAEQLDIIGKIFPARQATAFAALLATGSSELKTFTGQLQNATGTAARISGTLLDTLKGDFTILLSALEGVAIAIGEAFGNELRGAIRGISAFLGTLAGFIEANRKLALVIVSIPVGLVLLGTAITAIGIVVVSVGFIMAALIPVVGALGTVLGVLGSAISALASPLGVLSAAVLAVGLAFIDWQFVMNTVVDFIYKKFGQLGPYIAETFNLMSQAIAQGRFAEAVNVMFAGMELAFRVGTQELMSMWTAFGLSISLVWIDVTESIQSAAASLFIGLQQRLVTLQASWKYIMAIMKGEAIDWLQAVADAAALANKLSDLAKFDNLIQNQLREEANAAATEALAAYGADLAAAELKLQDAQKAFDAARQAIVAPEIPDDKLNDLEDKLRKVAGEAIGASKGSVVSGGFNAAVLARSFAGTEQKRTAKATEQTAKNTEKMLNNWINPLLVK